MFTASDGNIIENRVEKKNLEQDFFYKKNYHFFPSNFNLHNYDCRNGN